MKDTDTIIATEKEWNEIVNAEKRVGTMQDGKTRRELQEIWGVEKTAATERLANLVKQGRVKLGTKFVTTINGVQRKVPAYRIVKK